MSANIPILSQGETLTPKDLARLDTNAGKGHSGTHYVATGEATTHVATPAKPHMISPNLLNMPFGGRDLTIKVNGAAYGLEDPQQASGFPEGTVLRVSNLGKKFYYAQLRDALRGIMPPITVYHQVVNDPGKCPVPNTWAMVYRKDGYPFSEEQKETLGELRLDFGKGPIVWEVLLDVEQDTVIQACMPMMVKKALEIVKNGDRRGSFEDRGPGDHAVCAGKGGIAPGDVAKETQGDGRHPVTKNVVSAKSKRLNYIQLGGRKINLSSSSRCLVNPKDAIFPESTVLKVQNVGYEFNGQILSHRAKDVLPQLYIHGRYGQPWAWLYRSDGYPFTGEQLREASNLHLNFGKGEVCWDTLSPEEQEEAILHRLRRHGANIQVPVRSTTAPAPPAALANKKARASATAKATAKNVAATTCAANIPATTTASKGMAKGKDTYFHHQVQVEERVRNILGERYEENMMTAE
ncbi:hypothetical protein IAT38_005724 [Cryptococcus sp. DSM 104549]